MLRPWMQVSSTCLQIRYVPPQCVYDLPYTSGMRMNEETIRYS